MAKKIFIIKRGKGGAGGQAFYKGSNRKKKTHSMHKDIVYIGYRISRETLNGKHIYKR